MNFQDLRTIVGQIKKTISCPKCRGGYNDEDLEIIGTFGDELLFLHADCMHCEAQSVINVSIHIEGKHSLPNLTRLGSAPRNGQITTNEVLDMRNFLKNFSGNFEEMFEKNSSKKQS